MARDKKAARAPDEPQEEMTVVILKFRGGSQSLQKGFEAVSQAIQALGSAPASAPQHQPKQLPASDGDVIDTEAKQLPDQPDDSDDQPDAPISSNGRAKKSPPKYKYIGDFNLSPAGVPSLRDHCAEKDPQTDQDKFIVASAWIQTHGGIDPFTPHHLFTCFRAMDWKTQVDMTQPLRTLKLKKSYYESVGRGEWRLTNIGLEAAANINRQ